MSTVGNSTLVEDILGSEPTKYKPTNVFKSVDPHVDTGNLLLEDRDILESNIMEHELNERARDNIQCLLNEIWKLPSERLEEVVVVKLPKGTTRLPREKPLPKEKPMSKWTEFSKLKGIQNKKKPRKVWDNVSQSWKPSWGYQSAKDKTKDWMLEIPDQQDPYKDYFGDRIEAKKERVAKNELKRLRNLSRSSGNNVQEGIGLMNRSKSPQQLSRMVAQTRSSTASVGKFTETLPKEQSPRKTGKKRNFTPNEISSQEEKVNQLEILKRLGAKKPLLNIEQAITDQNKAQKQTERPMVKSKKKQKSDPRNQKKHGKMRHVKKQGKK